MRFIKTAGLFVPLGIHDFGGGEGFSETGERSDAILSLSIRCPAPDLILRVISQFANNCQCLHILSDGQHAMLVLQQNWTLYGLLLG